MMNYGQYGNYGYQIPASYPQYQLQTMQPQTQQIFGRYIDNVATVTANEVPMDGNRAFFPTNDGNMIYSKQWQSDGTIRTRVFKAIEDGESDNSTNKSKKTEYGEIKSVLDLLQNDINSIKEQLDKVSKPTRAKKEVADE